MIEIRTHRFGADRTAGESAADKVPRLVWVIAAAFVALELAVR